jgi:hypothetical protein
MTSASATNTSTAAEREPGGERRLREASELFAPDHEGDRQRRARDAVAALVAAILRSQGGGP